MVVWISGEFDAEVSEGYRLARNEIEDAINFRIENQNCGIVVKWALIPLVMNPEIGTYGEIEKYWKKKHEMEFRLKIDHAAFLLNLVDAAGKSVIVPGFRWMNVDNRRVWGPLLSVYSLIHTGVQSVQCGPFRWL
jgi:hypothetical protein